MEKNYNNMSHDEQVAVIGRLADYRQNSVPKLQAAGRFFNPSMRNLFFEGVRLLDVFPQFHAFCTDALAIKSNFDQYANRMMYLMNIISDQLASSMAVRTPSGEQVIVMAQSQILRRGRPTAAESERRRYEREQSERANVISRLSGARIITQAPAPLDTSRPTDTSRRKKKPQDPDLFSSVLDNIPSVPSVAMSSQPSYPVSSSRAVFGSQSSPDPIDIQKSLREWAWIMPEPIAQQIKGLRDTRAEIAASSEKAKSLFEQGASTDEIAAAARHAKELNRQVSDLYAEVDVHLATAYLMLTKVNREYGRWAERYAKHGGYDVLVSDLRPYYDKVVNAQPVQAVHLLEKARSLEAERVARETRDPAKEKRIHAIKSYFTRKDGRPTPERLQGLLDRYKEAVELGVDADTLAGFKVYIDNLEAYLTELASPKAPIPADSPSQ